MGTHYNVSYYQRNGYAIAIDAKESEDRIIASARVTAESRIDALRAAIQKFVERGMFPQSTANLYLRALKRGAKQVRIACAKA